MATCGDTMRMDGLMTSMRTPLFSLNKVCISFSMACLPWNRWPDRADPLAGFAPMRGHGLGIAAVVGGNVGVDCRPDCGFVGRSHRFRRVRG